MLTVAVLSLQNLVVRPQLYMRIIVLDDSFSRRDQFSPFNFSPAGVQSARSGPRSILFTPCPREISFYIICLELIELIYLLSIMSWPLWKMQLRRSEPTQRVERSGEDGQGNFQIKSRPCTSIRSVTQTAFSLWKK